MDELDIDLVAELEAATAPYSAAADFEGDYEEEPDGTETKLYVKDRM